MEHSGSESAVIPLQFPKDDMDTGKSEPLTKVYGPSADPSGDKVIFSGIDVSWQLGQTYVESS